MKTWIWYSCCSNPGSRLKMHCCTLSRKNTWKRWNFYWNGRKRYTSSEILTWVWVQLKIHTRTHHHHHHHLSILYYVFTVLGSSGIVGFDVYARHNATDTCSSHEQLWNIKDPFGQRCYIAHATRRQVCSSYTNYNMIYVFRKRFIFIS